MRIGDFIETHLDAIVDDWVTFARTINVTGTMDLKALRDHSKEILLATVADMRTPQTEPERESKSKGTGTDDDDDNSLIDASAEHATNRLGWGFDLMQVVSEYRALRASVLRLWARTSPEVSAFDVDDITRFNESIDQSLAKTIRSYSQGVDQAREAFIGILGHDLRQPLAAVSVYVQVARRSGSDSPAGIQALAAVNDAVRDMSGMIGDLLDFARSRLGSGIPVKPIPVDLAPLAHAIVDECRAVFPGCTLHVDAAGDAAGSWDAPRLRQAITNLLTNACRFGCARGPVRLSIDGQDADAVRVNVENQGSPIPPAMLHRLFNPMMRGEPAEGEASGPTGGVGLGLFVAPTAARSPSLPPPTQAPRSPSNSRATPRPPPWHERSRRFRRIGLKSPRVGFTELRIKRLGVTARHRSLNARAVGDAAKNGKNPIRAARRAHGRAAREGRVRGLWVPGQSKGACDAKRGDFPTSEKWQPAARLLTTSGFFRLPTSHDRGRRRCRIG